MSVKRKFKISVFCFVAVAMTAGGNCVLAQSGAANAPGGFPPVEQWKAAVLAGDAVALKSLYSTDPPAQVQAHGVTTGADDDVNFWLGLKAKSIKLEIVRLKERTNGESVIFKAEVQTANGQTINVTDAQGWQKQGERWRLAAAERTDAPQLQQPSDMNRNIYPDDADARAEIKDAEEKALRQHQRILLVFGANWCYDCHVLDLALHRPDFAAVMSSYEVVHVDLGPDGKKNADVARQFDVPLDKGIPVLAVLEGDGKVVFSQKNGEFEDARSLTPEALLAFLNKWEPEAR
jgi:ketosteroid isomerase-like protein